MIETEFYTNYENIDWLRESFFDFTPKALYGASFQKWYEQGCWCDRYICFSLLKQKQMLANVSISEMEILIDGEKVKGIQFSAVGTLPEYRNRGFAKTLINKVLTAYNNNTDLFFLFANDSVINFYPKFGFHQVKESIFTAKIGEDISSRCNFCAKKLNINKDWQIIKRLASSRLPITKLFGSTNYEHIFLCHAIYTFPGFLWYLESEDILIVFKQEGDKVLIYDILSEHPFSFLSILPKIIRKNIKQIDFYFTPELLDIETKPEQVYTESPLFVKGKFPIETQSFKFPIMAQT